MGESVPGGILGGGEPHRVRDAPVGVADDVRAEGVDARGILEMSFETTSDVLVTFTTKEYSPTAGEVVYPVDSLMPVKGVHEVPVREGGRGVAEHAVGGSFSAVR